MKKFRKIAIIKFAGGLGNQMFQYSYGEYLKLKGYDIYHDYISWFILYNRKFTIKDFNLNLKTPHKVLIIILTFLLKIRCSPYIFFEKKPFKYQNVKDSQILHCIGYWQNIEYESSYRYIVNTFHLILISTGIQLSNFKKNI